ncbi:uncharacterized protein EI90DRAFT_3129770 [Cantharellus anzutake]|uniref:uncharacterized protein n=1 Tax=Cantharellus anzutake TaxID=1750568 RepID=UPI0019070529|nr:uncharacterized protein EI90DRAFT_3129770 [Cantharellus anzutake]KAF8324593.1 hypothetical protein EI90DRAFT_3129770 [Cantharellus anzutake]
MHPFPRPPLPWPAVSVDFDLGSADMTPFFDLEPYLSKTPSSISRAFQNSPPFRRFFKTATSTISSSSLSSTIVATTSSTPSTLSVVTGAGAQGLNTMNTKSSSTAEPMFVGRSLNGRVVSLLNDDANNAAVVHLGLAPTAANGTPSATPTSGAPHHHQVSPQSPLNHLVHSAMGTSTTTSSAAAAAGHLPQYTASAPAQSSIQHQQLPSPATPTTNQTSLVPQPPQPHALPNGGTGRATATEKKRNHVCTTCSKAFTTSGHLARHIRVHTGERNHKCPFPGCETRCSRQDNLQQQ